MVRIKTCPEKTTRWPSIVRKIFWKSRRSAPRPRPKRPWPAWPACGNSAAFFAKKKLR